MLEVAVLLQKGKRMFEYKSLHGYSLECLAPVINRAFQNEKQSKPIETADLIHCFCGANVSLRMSYGAFFEGQLIGFIINAIDEYNGELTAFDIATGVIPEFQGIQIFTTLFQHCKEQLRMQNITTYCLEVDCHNERAIESYTKMGFVIKRKYACYKGSRRTFFGDETSLFTYNYKEEHAKQLQATLPFPPSFENRSTALARNAEACQILEYQMGEEVCAFAIFDLNNGAIRSSGLKKGWEKAFKEIILYINSRYDDSIIAHINYAEQGKLTILDEMGFFHYTDLIEMNLKL